MTALLWGAWRFGYRRFVSWPRLRDQLAAHIPSVGTDSWVGPLDGATVQIGRAQRSGWLSVRVILHDHERLPPLQFTRRALDARRRGRTEITVGDAFFDANVDVHGTEAEVLAFLTPERRRVVARILTEGGAIEPAGVISDIAGLFRPIDLLLADLQGLVRDARALAVTTSELEEPLVERLARRTRGGDLDGVTLRCLEAMTRTFPLLSETDEVAAGLMSHSSPRLRLAAARHLRDEQAIRALLAEGHPALASELSAALAALGSAGGGLAVVEVEDDGRGDLSVAE